MPGLPGHHQLLELAQTQVHRVGDAIQLYHPLLLLPSVFPRIRVFSKESAPRIRWPKYWSFSFTISPSNEYSGLISFRMDWLDLLAVQETLKNLLQHRSSKALIYIYNKYKILYNSVYLFIYCFFSLYIYRESIQYSVWHIADTENICYY